MLQFLSNTVKDLQALTLATLLKRDPLTGVSESDICKSSTKNNSQNSQENTYAGVS